MERVSTLVDKLIEQRDNHVPADRMLVTAHLLVAELKRKSSSPSSSSVSFFGPPANDSVLQPEVQPEVAKPEPTAEALPVPSPQQVPKPAEQPAAEVNDRLGHLQQGSLNEKLKMEKAEVGNTLESPVKDLRKAIGVNDRYVFINELFHGDESTYDRSIRAINAFNIYAEAEYWIRRELQHKLGWRDDSETFRHFIQLVRRRFS